MYYQKHLFFCVNERAAGKPCCHARGAVDACHYAKERISDLGLKGPGGVRVSSSGCLGRCAQGPILVIYPEGVWYTYHSITDVELILSEHVIHGKRVNHLLLQDEHT